MEKERIDHLNNFQEGTRIFSGLDVGVKNSNVISKRRNKLCVSKKKKVDDQDEYPNFNLDITQQFLKTANEDQGSIEILDFESKSKKRKNKKAATSIPSTIKRIKKETRVHKEDPDFLYAKAVVPSKIIYDIEQCDLIHDMNQEMSNVVKTFFKIVDNNKCYSFIISFNTIMK